MSHSYSWGLAAAWFSLAACAPGELILLGKHQQSAQQVTPEDAGSAATADAGNAPGACEAQKIAFTQATGCLNDGSVEFCLARGDAALEAAVQSIAPSVQAVAGGGRARCDSQSEVLFLFPSRGSDLQVCTAYHGAMTQSAWQQICELSALPAIREIVPTFFE
jgi:hypothetical protein